MSCSLWRRLPTVSIDLCITCTVNAPVLANPMVSLTPNSAFGCTAFIFTSVSPLVSVFKDCLPLAVSSSFHYLSKNVHILPHNYADIVFCPTISSYSFITCFLRNKISKLTCDPEKIFALDIAQRT